jgi:hypothetical protein
MIYIHFWFLPLMSKIPPSGSPSLWEGVRGRAILEERLHEKNTQKKAPNQHPRLGGILSFIQSGSTITNISNPKRRIRRFFLEKSLKSKKKHSNE